MPGKIVPAAPVPPFVTFVTSAVPMVFDNSMSYYEALCALWKWLQDDVINVINNNAAVTNEYIELTNEYIEKFNELKTYVDTYFENLDVQEEINNKLDAMVEDGQLTQLIAQFLTLNAIMTFPNVAALKDAENLVNGSTVETFGFYNANDGGGSKYLIRNIINTDVVDDITLVSLTHSNTLVAELVKSNPMNAKQFGAKGDGTSDDITYLQKAVDYITDKKVKLISDGSEYKITSTLEIEGDGINIEFAGSLIYSGANYAVEIKNSNYCDLSFKYIEALSGSGVKVETLEEDDYTSSNYNVINITHIKSNGINLDTYSENSMQYNKYNWSIFESKTKNISITILEDEHAWNNESIFNGGKLGGYDGTNPTNNIYVSANHTGYINGHKFNNVGLEGGSVSVYIKNARTITLNKPRTNEAPTSKTLELVGEVDCCHFDFLDVYLSKIDYANATGTNEYTGVFMNDSRNRMKFTSFTSIDGNMANCNQKEKYYKTAGTDTFGFPTESVFPNMFYVSASFKLDTHYYNVRNINEIYLRIGGLTVGETYTIKDQNNNVIADISDIRYKWYKLTLVPSNVPTLNGAVLDELTWAYS